VGEYIKVNFSNYDKLLDTIISKNKKEDELSEIFARLTSDIELLQKKLKTGKSNVENSFELSENHNLRDIINVILKNNKDEKKTTIYKLRYGFITEKPAPVKDLCTVFNLSEDDIFKIINEISEVLVDCPQITSYLEILNIKSLKSFAEEEFGSCNPAYFEMLKKLTQGKIKIKEEATHKDLKSAISACVKQFDGQYGRNGIAKILKGSKSLKDNEFNNSSKNSEYYGLFSELTLNTITNEIDDLIKEGILKTERKGNFARPVLVINTEIETAQTKLPQDENTQEIKTDNTCNDDNITKILTYLKNGENVFITGHAGTGKSYILNKLKEKLGKKLTITSTTGIAAVNVKGQTLHSWAGVGICNKPVKHTVESILKKSSVKKQIQKCEILAIDEISMLDINTFEYVDSVLSIVRENDAPFGGIQVIFIGDFFQLPPVDLNSDSPDKYCFESKLWQKLNLKTVLLTRNYRQKEENLIKALANMRTNSLTENDINLLKTRETPKSNEQEDILHIFATNFEADNYNNTKFKSINSPEHILHAFDGIYKGEKLADKPTNEREANILQRINNTCSAEKTISLKIGARVMLLINLDFEKGLINGSCGVVKQISPENITVKFDNGETAKISKHDFQFYNNDELIAVRKQFPLRLAYGITIHKSQGMSLDKLVVDCSRIFEKGQAYVALSRIKTLSGLHIRNFDPQKVMVDEKVAKFYEEIS